MIVSSCASLLVDDSYCKRNYCSPLGSCLWPVLLGILCHPLHSPSICDCSSFSSFSSVSFFPLKTNLQWLDTRLVQYKVCHKLQPFFHLPSRLWVFKWLSGPSLETGAWWNVLSCDRALWHWDPLHYLQHCWSFPQWGKTRKIKHQLQQSA